MSQQDIPEDLNEKTIEYYDNNALEWKGRHDTQNFWGEYRDKFFEVLPKGRLLEIGAGAGRDAFELIQHGYEYVGTEPSIGMIEAARERNPGADFRQARVKDLDFDSEFDGFFASASLLHIPKSEIKEALTKIRKALKPGGLGFITLKKHVDDLDSERVEEDGRFFSYWEAEDFEKILNECGFELVMDTQEKPMSEKTTWLIFYVRKVEEV